MVKRRALARCWNEMPEARKIDPFKFMMQHRNRIILALILGCTAIGLFYGWRLFWFFTDDAFIAFRYVSNSILGYGYTWNPPPFRPVEGYTSFLWVVILDGVWRTFGMVPPQIANYLSLGLSYITLLLTAFMFMRMELTKQFCRFRLLFLAMILLGTITNRTFLAWTSSGMETALFNFCVISWIVVTVLSRKREHGWLFGMTLSAGLVYLTRPDGILFIGCSILLSLLSLIHNLRQGRPMKKWFVAISPLLISPIHMGWRLYTYGEWLPNTYYAKHVAAWPAAGIRYFASFCLEYAVWVWFILLTFAVIVWIRKVSHERNWMAALLDGFYSRTSALTVQWPNKTIRLTLVVATLIAHLGYYTLIIGGDHFEYRIYSYLIPLIFVSFVWLLNVANVKPTISIGLLSLFVLLSYPLPWTHWMLTKNLNTRKQTHIMRVAIADRFPSPLQWYAEAFDNLQFWLIEHHVCMRHQEHKVFFYATVNSFPQRQPIGSIKGCEFPVMKLSSVGIGAWVFPQVAIMDTYGLNDYIIARNKVPPKKERLMAHDRAAPPGYLDSFMPNVWLDGPRRAKVLIRETKLTAEMIIANEEYWINRIVHGIDTTG